MASIQFDASQVAPKAASTPIPAGTYLAHIIESDVVDLKSGNGQGLKLTYEILDGQFKGRRVFDNLNIVHAKPDTQAIAQSQLSAICHAVGVIQLSDTAMLHYKPVKLTVTIKEAQGDFAARNNIKSVESAGGAVPAVTASAPAAAKPAANVPAWAKKA